MSLVVTKPVSEILEKIYNERINRESVHALFYYSLILLIFKKGIIAK